MKAHLKRIAMPKTWPLKRKENKFVIKGEGPHKLELSLPLLVILRDLLKVLTTKTEAKKILKENNAIVNNKVIKNIKFRVGLFDRIYFKKLEKYYSLYLNEKGKLEVQEITREKSEFKPCKIIGKKILKGKRTQLNCSDGRNFIISDDKFKVGDSIIIDLKNNKIIKHLKMEKGNFALIIEGKNRGACGKIESINNTNNTVIIALKDKKISVPRKNIFVLEENEYEK